MFTNFCQTTGYKLDTALMMHLPVANTPMVSKYFVVCCLFTMYDTALIDLISEDDDSVFLCQVTSFVNHFDANYMKLNVPKTKEMVIDVRQNRPDPQPVYIKGSAVARVDTSRYLGIVLNNKLSWGDHGDFVIKKFYSRMYCLKELNSFHIMTEILNAF